MADFDISSLSEEQQLALQQYTSVTDQDLAAAVPLLQKCQWNTQIAITRFFDGDADTIDPAAEAARAPPPPPANSRRSETLMDTIPTRYSTRSARRGLEPAPRVVPTPESQISQPMPFPFNIIFLPFNITYTIFQRLFGTIGYLFPFLPRLLNRLYSGRALQPSRDTGRRPLNPTDTAARFMREFEEEYGVTHGTLPFHESGYAQAFDLAKRDLKHLLVILLSPEHDDTAPFVRDTLLSPDLIEYIKEPANNIVLWAGTVQDAEAYQVANALNVTRFPFASLIAHTPSVSSTAMSKIATSAGPVSSQDLISKFTAAISAHKEELDRLRAQRQEQDREKARKRKEEEAEKEKAEREERERAERKADLARKLAQWRRWRAQSIPSEPDTNEKDVVRVSVRLPSGERVVRKFRSEAELEELYAFVECYDLLGDEGDVGMSEKQAQEPQDYEHVYKFQLYDLEKTGNLRERIGRSGNLIVERIVGEDDSDEDDDEEDRDIVG
jgi:FAS-associated factor 2